MLVYRKLDAIEWVWKAVGFWGQRAEVQNISCCLLTDLLVVARRHVRPLKVPSAHKIPQKLANLLVMSLMNYQSLSGPFHLLLSWALSLSCRGSACEADNLGGRTATSARPQWNHLQHSSPFADHWLCAHELSTDVCTSRPRAKSYSSTFRHFDARPLEP